VSEQLSSRLRGVLERRYHHLHPFNQRMHCGELSREELQLWVANRFYYQINIPVKDALILANCPEREVRQQWIQRIIDHDGRPGDEGGIEAWLRLGDACGLKRGDMQSLRHVLPGVRFAVDAYVNFARRASWEEAVCSSLTELFAPDLPTLCVGLRGLVYTELEAVGPKTDLHSGMYGGAAPNPFFGLIEIISKLKDSKGHILIPGFYKGVKAPTKDELKAWVELTVARLRPA